MKPLWAQVVAETRLTVRRGESLLLTLGIPVGLLAFLALTKVLPAPSNGTGYLVPGVLALAIMSTSMVSVGIATAFEREYKVLKRLGATPLGRPRLIAAKVLSVAAIEVVQAAVVLGAGLGLGWRPSGASGTVAALSALGAAVCATAGFTGLGLLMAGRLRADIVLALANGLWLALLLLGGMLFPLSKLPSGLRAFADGLPASALAGALRSAMGSSGHVPAHDWVVLAVWAVAAPLAAAFAFLWE
jgi:ABC-2 type transport system permease protein